MSRLLTEEQEGYLREIAPNKSVAQCTKLINSKFGTSFTESQIRSYKSNHHIVSGKYAYQFVDHEKRRLFSDEQIEWIKNNCYGLSNVEFTELYNCHFKTNIKPGQMKSLKNRYHITSGLTGRFEKGCVPLNKGKKMSSETYKKCSGTMFKKGNRPYNYKEIGTEQWLEDGFLWVKVDDQPNVPKTVNWIQKHRKLWIEHHGPIPKGKKVIFLDGDRTNITIENLALVSNTEMMILNRNNLIYGDSELTKVGINIAKVMSVATKKKNESANKD